MTEREIIDQILSQKHIAVAGVSRDQRKFGAIVYKQLAKNGYRVYPINPNMEEYAEVKCYPDVMSLPAEVTVLVTVTKPEVTRGLVQQAAVKGLNYVWMQQGSESKDAITAAEAAGIHLISKKCIMMFAEPVKSVHAFHRFLSKLFGRYPN
ncbi:MAG: CoA-binding protein [Bacteroidales bacterium]